MLLVLNQMKNKNFIIKETNSVKIDLSYFLHRYAPSEPGNPSWPPFCYLACPSSWPAIKSLSSHFTNTSHIFELIKETLDTQLTLIRLLSSLFKYHLVCFCLHLHIILKKLKQKREVHRFSDLWLQNTTCNNTKHITPCHYLLKKKKTAKNPEAGCEN